MDERLKRVSPTWFSKTLAPTLAVIMWLGAPALADEILVSAAASLFDALNEIGSNYRAKSGYRITFNFGSSSGLARQIDEGAPVDVFFSADLAQMDKLDVEGRLEAGTRSNLLSNRLVIIVPIDSAIALSSPKDLLKAEIKRIALGEPSSVPAGVYSRKYLAGAALWSALKAKIVPVRDVRATLASVESGNVEAGFVYKTDAAVSNKVKIAYEVPLVSGPKITYAVAIVRESTQKDRARDFIHYLRSPAAMMVFKKFGFIKSE